jgi:hypothetical protein
MTATPGDALSHALQRPIFNADYLANPPTRSMTRTDQNGRFARHG